MTKVRLGELAFLALLFVLSMTLAKCADAHEVALESAYRLR